MTFENFTQKQIGKPQPIVPGLYLVSTPIGNLRDITIRALDVLSGVDEIYCEDTRVSGKLLQAFGIKQKLNLYNDHSRESIRHTIAAKIEDGRAIALISDAGTPLISDPGYKLVKSCLEKKLYVTALPGGNAVLPALQLSGLPTDNFSFHGFLPSRSVQRQKILASWKEVEGSHVFFESAKRLDKTLADIKTIWGRRKIAIIKEITKKFEKIFLNSLENDWDSEELKSLKGELVIVVGALDRDTIKWTQDMIDKVLIEQLQKMSFKEAVAEVAGKTGVSKKEIYNRALILKSE